MRSPPTLPPPKNLERAQRRIYIILKHMIWRFQTYNLFCEILKSRRSKTEFRDEIYIFCETNCISRSRASE